MRILLDSNAYSAFMRGSHEVRDLIVVAEEVLFSAVVVGEQLYGFRQGAHFERNLAEFRSFLERPYVSFVPVGPVTADRVLAGNDGAAGQGAANSDQRRLDCGPRHGNGRRPGIRRQPLRAR